MADLPPDSDSNGGPDRGSPPSTPLWVKVSGIIVIILALAFIGLRLAGHGPRNHGPGRHKPSGDRAPLGSEHRWS